MRRKRREEIREERRSRKERGSEETRGRINRDRQNRVSKGKGERWRVRKKEKRKDNRVESAGGGVKGRGRERCACHHWKQSVLWLARAHVTLPQDIVSSAGGAVHTPPLVLA